MFIKKLILKGYERLLLNNIDLFIYTPESIYQLILGTNGSGKSSVLKELSPLPAHKSQYSKGGYKIIEIDHAGASFVLKSSFESNPGGKHSFIMNGGEDLNPGGTAEVQKQLCVQYFEYTKDLHDILTGQKLFTRLSPADRRKQISWLSINDYSWAINVHRQLATAARDQQGAAKHLKQRLAQEHASLAMMGSLEGLDEMAYQLRQELNALLTARAPSTGNVGMINSQMDRTKQQMQALSQDVIKSVAALQAMGRNLPPPDALEQHATELGNALSAKQALVNRLSSEYVELETAIHGFTTSDGITPENIGGHLMDLGEQIDGMGRKQTVFGDLQDARLMVTASRAAVPRALELFALLPDNTDRRFSRYNVEERKQQLAVVRNDMDKLDREMRKAWHRIEHIKLAKGQTCPSCSHEWQEGVQPGELHMWEEAHDDYTKSHASLGITEKSIAQFLEEAESVSGLYRQFVGLTNDYPSLSALWTYVSTEKMHLERPRERIGVFTEWLDAVEHAARCEELLARQAQLRELQRQWEASDGIGHLGQRMAKVMAEVEEQTRQLSVMRAENTTVQTYQNMVTQLNRKVADLHGLQDQINRQFSDWTEATRSEQIDRVTHLHQSELASIQQRLTEHRTLEGIVKDLSNSLDAVTVSRDDLALLADELSPIEGLIAEQLRGFIECLVGQLNSIIQPIWTYDLVILPCDMSSGELDYRFPVQTPFMSKPSSDIVETSKGQEQMINLAYQLTVMLYKGLTDYPLFLDEPGEGFDEQHRNNLMVLIKSLMDSGQHSQLFMVSHYASNHGMFTQADVTVLDGSNIAIAGEYNKNVVLG